MFLDVLESRSKYPIGPGEDDCRSHDQTTPVHIRDSSGSYRGVERAQIYHTDQRRPTYAKYVDQVAPSTKIKMGSWR